MRAHTLFVIGDGMSLRDRQTDWLETERRIRLVRIDNSLSLLLYNACVCLRFFNNNSNIIIMMWTYYYIRICGELHDCFCVGIKRPHTCRPIQ